MRRAFAVLHVVPESKIGFYCERSINQVSAKCKKRRIYISYLLSPIFMNFVWHGVHEEDV